MSHTAQNRKKAKNEQQKTRYVVRSDSSQKLHHCYRRRCLTHHRPQESRTSNIAREAGMGAGIPVSVPSHTISQACISGGCWEPSDIFFYVLVRTTRHEILCACVVTRCLWGVCTVIDGHVFCGRGEWHGEDTHRAFRYFCKRAEQERLPLL